MLARARCSFSSFISSFSFSTASTIATAGSTASSFRPRPPPANRVFLLPSFPLLFDRRTFLDLAELPLLSPPRLARTCVSLSKLDFKGIACRRRFAAGRLTEGPGAWSLPEVRLGGCSRLACRVKCTRPQRRRPQSFFLHFRRSSHRGFLQSPLLVYIRGSGNH